MLVMRSDGDMATFDDGCIHERIAGLLQENGCMAAVCVIPRGSLHARLAWFGMVTQGEGEAPVLVRSYSALEKAMLCHFASCIELRKHSAA